MTIAERTRSKANQAELEGMATKLQEILRKLETFDTRLDIIESSTHLRKEKEEGSEGEYEGGCAGKLVRRTENYGDRVTRQTKVEFPCFERNRVHEWLFKSDRFFELDGTPAELKVSVASVYLSGLAMEWHYAFVKNRKLQGSVSWNEYANAMVTHFGPIDMKRLIAQLKRLRKEESFFAYVDAFVSLVSQVKLSDEDQVAMFVEGLKRDNKKFIMVLNPSNLQQAIGFAKTLTAEEDPYKEKRRMTDSILGAVRPLSWNNIKQIQYGTNSGAGHNSYRASAPVRLSAVSNGKPTPYQPPYTRVSHAEIKERRIKGLCFWCDKKFTFGRKCLGRRLYSLVLELAEEVEEVEESKLLDHDEGDVAELSLHVLHGLEMSMKNQTMKLIGYYKKRRLNILIDSGSTHNFLDLAVAKQLGCSLQKVVTQRVMVANDNKMECSARIKGLVWTMQGRKFEANVLLMPLKGCELILGVEWLNVMGVINWDFPNRIMKFRW